MEKTEDKNEIIVEAIYELAKSIRLLGNGNIDRGDNAIGAIEGHAILTQESNSEVASSINGIASTLNNISESMNDMTTAIEHFVNSQ